MPRYKLVVQYIGSRYCGFQSQGSSLSAEQTTVQQALEAALGKLVPGYPTPSVFGCGRTDTGVHALGMPVHVDIERFCRKTGEPKAPFSAETLLTSINYHLRGEDIVVTEVKTVSNQFHARRSATSRSYLYRIAHRCAQLPVFETKRVLRVYRELNPKLMQEAASRLIGTHDFTSFRALSCEASSPVRMIMSFDVIEQNSCDILGTQRPKNAGSLLNIIVKANGFLYHQVRNMVAFLISVGKGDHRPEDTDSILQAKDRSLIPHMVSAEALYFLNAEYPAEVEDCTQPAESMLNTE